MNITVLSGIGILLGVIVLFIMAFKGFHNVYVAVAAVAVMALLSGMSIYDTLMGSMMPAAGGYISNYYLLFVAGAALGAVYKVTGAGSTVADALIKVFGVKHANFAIFLFSYIAILGGIQSFVAVFAVYPVALRLYEKANINKAILPAVVCGGMWTVGHTSPFAPSVPNQIASDALGTSNSAGWLPGIIFVVVASAMIVFYANRTSKKMAEAGQGFNAHEDLASIPDEDLPALIPSLIPLVVVFALYNFLHVNVTLSTWAGVVIGILLFWKKKTPAEWKEQLTVGAKDGTVVVVNTALVIAVGSVIAELPFYNSLMEFVTTMNINPYVMCVIATAIFATVTASGSGAITIVFRLLSPLMKTWGEMGYNLDYIHRLTVQSVSCWDSLPHCGPLIGVFSVCKVTHKEAYKHVFITTIVIPIIACYLVELPICMLLGRV